MDKSQITSSIPAPMAKGVASDEFGRPWSVYRCLPGRAANVGGIADLVQFGADLANFLTALQRIDTTNGPVAGPHSHFRGGLVTTHDATHASASVNSAQSLMRRTFSMFGIVPLPLCGIETRCGFMATWQPQIFWWLTVD